MQQLTRPQLQLQEIVQQNKLRICSKSNIKLSQSFNPSGLLSQSPTHKTNQSSGFQGIDLKQLQKCQGQLLQGKQYKKELLKLMTSHKQLSTQQSIQQNNISDTSNNIKTIATTDTRRTNSNQLQKSFIQTIKNQSFVSVTNQIVVVVHYLNSQYKFTIDPQKSTGYMMEYLKSEMKKHSVVNSTTGSSSYKNKLQCETGNECLNMEIVSFNTVDKNIPIDFYILQLNKPLDIFSGQTLDLQPFYGCSQGSQITLKDFIFIKCIGVGGFSRVYLVKKKSDGRLYAMKLIDKEFIIQRKKQGIVQNERDIMTVLDHPFINKLEYAFESKNFIVFVLEFCSGGELFWQLKQVKKMTEDQARFYFTEICLAIYYLHSISVVYRDIKPENILIDIDGHIRIADFGLSKPNMNEDDYAYSFCGSPEYMAPEMLLKVGHNVQVDHYCLGALLYELVTGLPPYYSRDTEEIYESILSEELTFPEKINLTNDIKDLLKGLLCKKPQSRLGAHNGLQELMLHPWFKGCDWIQILQRNIEPPFKPNQLQFHYDQNELLKGELETREKLLGKSGIQKDIKIFKTFYFDATQQKQMKIEQSKVLKQHFTTITQIQVYYLVFIILVYSTINQLLQFITTIIDLKVQNQKDQPRIQLSIKTLIKRIPVGQSEIEKQDRAIKFFVKKNQILVKSFIQIYRQSSLVQPIQINTAAIPQQSKFIGLKRITSQNNFFMDRQNTSPTNKGYNSKDNIDYKAWLQNGLSGTNLHKRVCSLKQRIR